MPDRIIRAAIITSDRVNAVSWGAEVFYRRLMSVADDYGRYDGRPAILRAQLYALKLDRVSESDVGKWIRECEEAALVRVYTVDTRLYLEIMRFGQRARSESKWPDPPSIAGNCPPLPAECGHSPPYSYAKSYAKSKSVSPPAPPSETGGGSVEEVYAAYPRKVGKEDALKAIAKAAKKVPLVMLLAKTQIYAEATALWPPGDLRFIPHPATWFNRGSYDDDPATWIRTDTNGRSALPADLRFNLTENAPPS